MTIKHYYRNPLEKFGDPGPWLADSREELANDMSELFAERAADRVAVMERDEPESLWDVECLAPGQTWREYFMAEIRADFITGLVEVSQ